MDEETRQEYISKMVENLPVLRAKLKLTQKDFADLIGVSNYSVSGMENGQRKMTWNTFMSILPVFMSNSETAELLEIFGIYTPELEAFLHMRSFEPLTDSDLDEVAAAGVNVISLKPSNANAIYGTPKTTGGNSKLKPGKYKVIKKVQTKDPN